MKLNPILRSLVSQSGHFVWILLAAGVALPVLGQDASEPAAPAPAVVVADPFDTLEPMVVIGSRDAVFNLPGSGYFVDSTEIRAQNYQNVNRVLARVPGVYVREEDGNGLFPNISIRGGDGTRSENVTIMEDGILTAPATYSAPAAYYSPNAGRMAGIEVLKGSSQVRYGPHTTGGVVNYLSTPIPQSQRFYLRSTYGSHGTALNHGNYGDVVVGDFGRIGFLAELWHSTSDGFRTIDSAPGFPGSNRTGYTLIEPMFKLFWEPGTATPQRFEFKYGYTQFDADETYVGLSERDLIAGPYRRYAGTFLDNIATEQHRTYLKYLVEPTDSLSLEFAGYYNQFSRNWYKISDADGEAIHEILANPARHSHAFNVLRMRAPGELKIRANNRDYEAYGFQGAGDLEFATGEVGHTLHFGARWHSDEVSRFQRDDTIVVGSGRPRVRTGAPGSGDNRVEDAEATAVWIQDTLEMGRLSVSPGVRYETVRFGYTDYLPDATFTPVASGRGNTDAWAPGVGFNYELTEQQSLFGGVFKGISAPDPRSHLKDGVDWEESVGYELGARHRSEGFSAELAGFFSDFSNITGSDAGLGGSNISNAGAAEVYGIEALASYDPLHGQGIGLPLFASATWTTATLKNALSGGGGDDILAGGVPGAAIPYIPEWKLAAGVGLRVENWGLDLMGTYVSDAYGTARNTDRPVDSSREGLIDGGFTVDLSGHYQVNEQIKLIAGIHNLLDEQLVTSRAPDGPRVGAPRQFYVGFEMLWEPRQEGISLEAPMAAK